MNTAGDRPVIVGHLVRRIAKSEAVVESPAGSDLISEWQFYFGVAQRMNLELTLKALAEADAS